MKQGQSRWGGKARGRFSYQVSAAYEGGEWSSNNIHNTIQNLLSTYPLSGSVINFSCYIIFKSYNANLPFLLKCSRKLIETLP